MVSVHKISEYTARTPVTMIGGGHSQSVVTQSFINHRQVTVETLASEVYFAKPDGLFTYDWRDAEKDWTWMAGVWETALDRIHRSGWVHGDEGFVRIQDGDTSASTWGVVEALPDGLSRSGFYIPPDPMVRLICEASHSDDSHMMHFR